MGLPSGAPRDADQTTAEDGQTQQALNAPLRLEAETYSSFALRLAQHTANDAPEVEDELRRLGMDPEVFYRGAKPLGLWEYSADDFAPGAPAVPADQQGPSIAGLAAAFAEASGIAGETHDPADEFRPPPRRVAADDREVGGAWADQVMTPRRAARAKREALGFEDDQPGGPLPLTLNVPENDFEEEIRLEGRDAGETFGGRLGHETPRELEAKLQIDSLTDDEDDPFIGRASGGQRERQSAPDAEEPVETFSLDPNFDYDNTASLTRRV